MAEIELVPDRKPDVRITLTWAEALALRECLGRTSDADLASVGQVELSELYMGLDSFV